MKIYCITTKLNFVNGGGSSDENDLLFRTLQNMGNEIVVITAYSSINNIPNQLPYKVIEENLSSKRQLGIQLEIFRLIKKYAEQADVIHIDGHIFLYGAGTYRFLGGDIPIMAFFNRELTAWPENISTYLNQGNASIIRKIKQWLRFNIEHYFMVPLANYIDFFEFTNPILEKSYNDFGIKTKKRSLIIGELFDWPQFMRQYAITKTSYQKRNKRNSPFTILYVGRMVAGKGFDLLITAFSKLNNKDGFHLTLVGNGPEEVELQRMVKSLNLSKYVTFTGYLAKKDLYKFFANTDIFIQPRWRHDMSSMSLLTAMIFGIPSIVPAGSGLAWMANKSALNFKDNDQNDLACKIEELGNNYCLKERLSSYCYERLDQDIFQYKNRVEYVNKVMKQLLQKTMII